MTYGYLLRTTVLAGCAANAIGSLASILYGMLIAINVTLFTATAKANILVVNREKLGDIYMHWATLNTVLAACAGNGNGFPYNLSCFESDVVFKFGKRLKVLHKSEIVVYLRIILHS